MTTQRLRTFFLTCAPMVALALATLPDAIAGQQSVDSTLPAALTKPIPESIQDLQAIERQVKIVVARVMPAIVNVKSAGAKGGQGSGVVISEDGYVLTAAHVPGANKDFILTFPDGKKVKATALGQNKKADSGLLKITEEGKYPFCDMGKSGDLAKGTWCIAIGHPGGLREGRSPPVRLGRVNAPVGTWVTTEAVLVGGDSGGPLFDMHGKVIGIHSRIANSLTSNMHVPVDIYREEWDRLAKGEVWGTAPGGGGKGGGGKGAPTPPVARLGIVGSATYAGVGVKIDEIAIDSPAERAGLKVGDIIKTIDAKGVANLDELKTEVGRHRPGDEVTLEVRRGEETLKRKVVLDRALQ